MQFISETLGFGSSKRVEQMSQWAQSPKMAGFFTHSYGKIFR